MFYTNYFIEQLKCAGDRIVLHKGKSKIRATELYEQSTSLANGLAKLGIKKGDRVVLACQPGVDFLVILYACMMLRVIVSIIDPEMGRANYRAKLKQFNPKCAFLDSRLLLLQEHPVLRWLYLWLSKQGLYFPKVKGLSLITTGPWLPLLSRHTRLNRIKTPASAVNWQDAPDSEEFIVTYTSGTLSEPKGVVHTYASIAASVRQLAHLIYRPSDVALVTHLPHFMLIGVCLGIPTFIWDYKKGSAYKLQFIKDHNITTYFGPPPDYLDWMTYCEQKGQRLPGCLQQILLGSAPVHVTFLKRLVTYLPAHTQVTCLYGMTENLFVAYMDGREKARYEGTGDPLGTLADAIQLRVQEDGEICIQSEQLFKRYLHLNELQLPHCTGDLGYVNEEGKLILTGRKKEMIIRRNFNIYPALYEPTIKKIKHIEEAVLIGIYDENRADERVVLAVECSGFVDKKELMQNLTYGEYSIDKEALPDEIVFTAIPRKGRQRKIDREALKVLITESLAV